MTLSCQGRRFVPKFYVIAVAMWGAMTILSMMGCRRPISEANPILVSGELRFRNQAASGAIIRLVPLPNQANHSQPEIPGGIVDQNGRFVIDGAGWAQTGRDLEYVMLVFWPYEEGSGESVVADRLRGRYSDIQSPLRRVRIGSESIDLGQIDLEKGDVNEL